MTGALAFLKMGSMLSAQTSIGMLAMDCAHHSTRLTLPVFEKVLRGFRGQHFEERTQVV